MWSLGSLLIRGEKCLVNGMNDATMGAESWLTCSAGCIVLAEGRGPVSGLESLTSDQGLYPYCGWIPSTQRSQLGRQICSH